MRPRRRPLVCGGRRGRRAGPGGAGQLTERSNAEVFKAAVVAFNWNDMDALARLCTEDVVNVPFEGWPDAQIYHGRDGMKRLASTWWDNFAGTHMKLERLIEQGDRIVVLITHTGVVSGVEVAQAVGGIIHFRDGLMERLEWFLGFDQTLAAAGV